MSNASLIVAVSPEQIAERGGVEGAVMWNMQPFEESEQVFRHNSGRDGWLIEGRMAGRFESGLKPLFDWGNGGNFAKRSELIGESFTADVFVANRRWYEGMRLCRGPQQHDRMQSRILWRR